MVRHPSEHMYNFYLCGYKLCCCIINQKQFKFIKTDILYTKQGNKQWGKISTFKQQRVHYTFFNQYYRRIYYSSRTESKKPRMSFVRIGEPWMMSRIGPSKLHFSRSRVNRLFNLPMFGGSFNEKNTLIDSIYNEPKILVLTNDFYSNKCMSSNTSSHRIQSTGNCLHS